MNIRKTVSTMKTTSGSVTDYCGNFIYADNQLITTFAGDVRIAPVNFGNSTYWKYEYSMKDHLGNTRVIFAAHSYGQPELLQQTSYYPFGMTMQQQNFYSQNTTENKYLYNSKELQDDQLAGNICYLPNKGTEFSHLSWPRGVYGDMPGDGEEFMCGGSHTPFLESRKKTEKVVEKKVEQGDFNNFDLFDFYVSSFETPGMSFNVQIHPDIDGEETEEEKKTTGGGGPGWEAYVGAAASTASEMFYSKTFGTWMGKDFKMYKQTWGGNGVTGGKLKFGKKVSTGIKIGGYGLGIWNAYKIDQQNRTGQISDWQMYMEQGSNLITTVGGLYGAAWSVGWELGRALTKMEWYQEAKFNFWYNRWESQVGPPSQSNEALWYYFYQNYKP